MDHSINEQAAEWVLRINSDDPKPSEQDYEEFEHWKNLDKRHAEAVSTTKKLIDNIDRIPKTVAKATLNSAKKHHSRNYKATTLSLALAFVMVSISLFALQLDTVSLLLSDIRSSANTGLSKQLPDSSSIRLASNSAINVDFDHQLRRIELVDGHILVDVAKDSQRPFVVETTHGKMRALGTRFIVEKRTDMTRLTVLESRVSITIQNTNETTPYIVLDAGQQIYFTHTDHDKITKVNIQSIENAWKNNLLVADQEPLTKVLKRLSEHYNQRYYYSDKPFADIEITAVLPMNNHHAALNLLAESMPIEVKRYPPLLTIISAKPDR